MTGVWKAGKALKTQPETSLNTLFVSLFEQKLPSAWDLASLPYQIMSLLDTLARVIVKNGCVCVRVHVFGNNIFPPFSNIKKNFVADCIIATEVNYHKHSGINNTDLSCNSINQKPHMGHTELKSRPH